jgi:hypothetical protein
MKRRTLFFLLALSSLQPLWAQFSLGLEGGLNWSTVQYSGISGVDSKYSPGFWAGVSPRYSFDETISIITDINYSQIGHQIENEPDIENSRFRDTYWQVSPQLEYKIFDFLGVAAGFYAGFKIDEEQKMPGEDWLSTKEFDLIKNEDYGLLLAVRSYYKGFFLKLAYEHGLQNINNVVITDENGQLIDAKTFNRNIQVGVGYLIPIEKK